MSYTLQDATSAYLRAKRRRLAESSFREYQRVMEKLALDLGPESDVSILEPPRGTETLEDFLDGRWGSAPHAYNRNLSVVRGLMRYLIQRDRLRSDPCAPIERARPERHTRSTFDEETVQAIVSAASNPRDRIALRLLLVYGLRKGALTHLQLVCFDHARRTLSFKTKGRKYHTVPVVGDEIWRDLGEIDGHAGEFLLHRQNHKEAPLSPHGVHLWWYQRLTDAGVVAPGTTSGVRMHLARHSAGQRVLNQTGNLKAVQQLLGHASISTTGDVYSLDLETPILTADGWRTMGTVLVGDLVFAADGSLTPVTHTSEVFDDADCYAVSFADGSTVVASSDHRWPVWGLGAADGPSTLRVLTTGEIASTRTRYRVRCAALRPTSELGADPHVLEYQRSRRPTMGVVDVRRVPRRPTRCIAVAHPLSVFLVGRTFVPTHNTDWGQEQLRDTLEGVDVRDHAPDDHDQ